MNETYLPPAGSPPPVNRQGMGCFAKGCIATIILFIVLGVAVVGGLCWYAYGTVRPFVSTQPVPVRIYPATDAQYASLVERLHAFPASLAAEHLATLKLSADDLNTFIARDPGAKGIRGRVYFSIVNDEMLVETSAPLPSSKNRATTRPGYYFNAKVYLSASFVGGEVIFDFHQLETLDGKPPSAPVAALMRNPSFMRGLNQGFNRSFNVSFRQGLSRNPAAVEFLDKIRTINILDNQIVVTAADR